jgi:hypothetical protein
MIWGASPWADRPWAAAPAAAAGGGTLALTGTSATSAVGTELVGLALPMAGSGAAASAGTLAPGVTIALAGSQAASAAGTITPTAADVTVALSGQAATSAAGTLVQSSTVALLGAVAPATAGALTASGGDPIVVTGNTGAGRSRKRRARVVEIDGVDHIVNSAQEAQSLLDHAQAQAEVAAETAIARASKTSVRKPLGKVMREARKTLSVPEVTAPAEFQGMLDAMLHNVQQRYSEAAQTIEIAALLRKAQQNEQDDEDILMMAL